MRPSNIRCQQSEQGVELAILGEITSYTAADIIAALNFFRDRPATITMMSGGGDAFASLGIYDFIRGRDVTVRIYGIAASGAAIVAAGAKNTEMAAGAFLMIHNAYSVVDGEGDDVLASINERQVDIFSARTGMRKDKVKKMLEDETESPVWRDYCLQFLSECLPSCSDPDAIKAALTRYSKGKDGLAGTAIVHFGFQEGKGRLQPDESFSQQLEQQLADPEVVTPTKLSILGMIGKRQDVRLLPLVRTYASDTNDSLRRTAIATLGLMGMREDLPLIQAGLTNANRAVQMAAKAALEADPSVVNEMIAIFKTRRDRVYEGLSKIPGLKINLPEAAFYFYIDVTAYFNNTDGETVVKSSEDMAMYLLRKVYVATVAGDAFGDSNCIRISYATSEENLDQAVSRMAQALSELKPL
jgi:ATP-dependent protease ClpP protease subunit